MKTTCEIISFQDVIMRDMLLLGEIGEGLRGQQEDSCLCSNPSWSMANRGPEVGVTVRVAPRCTVGRDAIM